MQLSYYANTLGCVLIKSFDNHEIWSDLLLKVHIGSRKYFIMTGLLETALYVKAIVDRSGWCLSTDCQNFTLMTFNVYNELWKQEKMK